MIIPPDPEKDPRLFDPTASTYSLVEPSISDAASISSHDRSHAVTYPFGDENALNSNWDAESLPPYSRQRRSHLSTSSINSEILGDPGPTTQIRRRESLRQAHSQSQLELASTLSIHHPASNASLTPTASINHLPQLTIAEATSTSTISPLSTTKLWEGSSDSKPRRKPYLCCLPPLPIPVRVRKWWKRWRKWIYGLIIVILIFLGVVVGVVVGRRTIIAKIERAQASYPYDQDPKKHKQQQASWNGDGSFNLTYSKSRDGPTREEGNFTQCNNFNTLNITSSPFSAIFTPLANSPLSIVSFSFPLNDTINLSNMFFIARGLGSSGTTTFAGSDSSQLLTGSGEEGKVLVDVVVRYGGEQELGAMMRVCSMSRDDGSVGVGIYSPTQTDGQSRNPFNINPAYIPMSHLLIRLPPSAFDTSSPPLYAPSLSIDYDNMAVRLGNMRNVLDFGTLNVTSGRGVRVTYAAMEQVYVHGCDTDVSGQWNVSQSINVNVSDATISADVILFDPNTSDNATTLSSNSDTYNAQDRRSLSISQRDISSPTHFISTSFATTNGPVSISYLHHPTSVALSSVILTQNGDMNVRMNPNYVGPFAVKNVWGGIHVPQPETSGTGEIQDPYKSGRKRQVEYGIIDPSLSSNQGEQSIYGKYGINETTLENSTNIISGVAYWAQTRKKQGEQVVHLESVQEVQSGNEGKGNELLVLGAWGDVLVSFDGM